MDLDFAIQRGNAHLISRINASYRCNPELTFEINPKLVAIVVEDSSGYLQGAILVPLQDRFWRPNFVNIRRLTLNYGGIGVSQVGNSEELEGLVFMVVLRGLQPSRFTLYRHQDRCRLRLANSDKTVFDRPIRRAWRVF